VKSSWIDKENIQLQVEVQSWEEAIQVAGQILERNHSSDAQYTHAMIQAVHELGPYIVLVPHVALAHARPSQAVKKDDISLITLKDPISFGHQQNDPVHLVFAFCATGDQQHLEKLTLLASVLENESLIKQIAHTTSKDEVIKLLSE
jgi:PTS system ascorbate-specific IIA component